MASSTGDVRVGVDIGGTFTDIAVQIGSDHGSRNSRSRAINRGLQRAIAVSQQN